MKMIFDVESNGLYGEGFAVGWVVVTEDGVVLSEGYEACQPEETIDPWVAENVMPHLPAPTKKSAELVRTAFWRAWTEAKEFDATLWADCGYPVEANFLAACVADFPQTRTWQGPYPLHEIATVFELAGWDSTTKHDRLENETPHHPLGDSRQSARLLLKAIAQIKGEK